MHRTANPIAIVTKPNDAEKVWIARNGVGVYYSTDAGASWVWRSNGLTNLNVLTLEMAPDNPNVIFAGCESYSPEEPNVFRTTDGGQNWSQTQSSPTTGSVFDIETPSAASNIILAGCWGGIYKSTDGGNNWNQKWGYSTMDIARDPSNEGVFYAANDDFFFWGIIKSTDYGETWQDISPSNIQGLPKKVAISSRPIWTLFVATDVAGVYWTNDSNGSWWRLAARDEGIYDQMAFSIAIDTIPLQPNFLLLATRTYLYRSTDFGNSWTPSVSGMRKTVAVASFSPAQPDYLYAKVIRDAGWSFPAATIYRSLNQGDSWDLIYSFTSAESFLFGPRNIVAHPQSTNTVHFQFKHWDDVNHRIYSSFRCRLNMGGIRIL